VRKVLFLIPHLEHSGAAKQLFLLAAGLPRAEFDVRVASLWNGGAVAKLLRRAGVPVEELGWSRLFDLKPFWRLRELVKVFRPDVTHTWQHPSLRAVTLAVGAGKGRLVASAVLGPARLGIPHQWLDPWCLAQADCLVAGHAGEVERARQLSRSKSQVILIPPGVSSAPPTLAGSALRLLLGLPDEARLILCVGPLEPNKGFQDALWAFDILKFLYDDLHLVLIGEGSERGHLEQFAAHAQLADRAHFVGARADVPSLLAQGDVVWVPDRREGGSNTTLEAMAAGRPVVVSRRQGLSDIVIDGATGFVVAAGDKIALARQTRRLLDDLQLRRKMGEAGRTRSLNFFSAARMVEGFIQLYTASRGP
jgi:glycosyltransferase involved in cell wall biosynthesis